MLAVFYGEPNPATNRPQRSTTIRRFLMGILMGTYRIIDATH